MAKSALNKSAEYERYYQELGKNPETSFFDSLKDVFMFAAVLGFRNGKRIPIQRTGGDSIKLSYFNTEDENIFNIIALSDTNDISILLNDEVYSEKKYRIVEEYANGGMSIIAEAFCKPVADVNEFKKFIESYDADSGEQPMSNLEDILARALNSI